MATGAMAAMAAATLSASVWREQALSRRHAAPLLRGWSAALAASAQDYQLPVASVCADSAVFAQYADENGAAAEKVEALEADCQKWRRALAQLQGAQVPSAECSALHAALRSLRKVAGKCGEQILQIEAGGSGGSVMELRRHAESLLALAGTSPGGGGEAAAGNGGGGVDDSLEEVRVAASSVGAAAAAAASAIVQLPSLPMGSAAAASVAPWREWLDEVSSVLARQAAWLVMGEGGMGGMGGGRQGQRGQQRGVECVSRGGVPRTARRRRSRGRAGAGGDGEGVVAHGSVDVSRGGAAGA